MQGTSTVPLHLTATRIGCLALNRTQAGRDGIALLAQPSLRSFADANEGTPYRAGILPGWRPSFDGKVEVNPGCWWRPPREGYNPGGARLRRLCGCGTIQSTIVCIILRIVVRPPPLLVHQLFTVGLTHDAEDLGRANLDVNPAMAVAGNRFSATNRTIRVHATCERGTAPHTAKAVEQHLVPAPNRPRPVSPKTLKLHG